jgi:2-polyprenyl-6-methoxyphenol hydroxylase-like FAD-dependent oxidoreductase
MILHKDLDDPQTREVIVIGGGIAGLSAGQGAAAAQAINYDLFEQNLKNHSLRRFREVQLAEEQTVPRGA